MTETDHKLITKSSTTNFEDVFDQIGHFGRYQKFVFIACLVMAWPMGFAALASGFTHLQPDFSCVGKNITIEHKNDTCGNLIKQTCQDYCKQYEFNDQIFKSTVVSEFELVCKDWPGLPNGANTVISMLFFVGMASGAVLNGFVARDVIGPFFAPLAPVGF